MKVFGEFAGVRGWSISECKGEERAKGLDLLSMAAPKDKVRRSKGTEARLGLDAVEPERRVRFKHLGSKEPEEA